MRSIYFYKAQNDDGQLLLDDYLRPLTNHLGLRLTVSKGNEDRNSSLQAQRKNDLVLWDCSVETGHVYHAFNEIAKSSAKDIILSRTALPRNVLARQQCAPIHGEHFSNAELSEWLERRLYSLVEGARALPPYKNEKLASHYWMFDNPADLFLSFRGTHKIEALGLSEELEREQPLTVRMVPEKEYAYDTECVTLQQMWEGVARLTHEMTVTKRIAVFLTEDYFDSFWTSSELLSMVKHWRNNDNTIERGFLLRDKAEIRLEPLKINSPSLPVPAPKPAQLDRIFKILNNSDPLTTAPDTQVRPSGILANILALALRPLFGYYDPEFTGASFWASVRVPCPHCRPHNRPADEIDWDEHLKLTDSMTEVDYFGYFSVMPQELLRGQVDCPSCRTRLYLENKHPPRTLWKPIQATEKEKDRPVIEENPVWEVLGKI